MTTTYPTEPNSQLDSATKIVDDLSRRKFGMAVGLSLAGFLTACGASDDNPRSASSDATRTVSTPMGDVAVPSAPARIVSLDAYVGLQTLDELGVPVAASGTLGGGLRTLVSDSAQQLPSIGVTALGDVQLEAIAAAAPDLIVGRQPIGEPLYAELSTIAPTVLVPFSYWRDQYIDIADAVDRKDEALDKFVGLDGRIGGFRDAVATAWPSGVRVSVVRVSDTSGDVRSYNTLAASSTFLYADILSGAGIEPTANSAAGADPAKVNVAVSAENLPLIDADVIIYYVGAGGQADAGADVEQSLTGGPLWGTLDAVRAGRAYKVHSAPWFDGYNLAAANAVIDDLHRILVP